MARKAGKTTSTLVWILMGMLILGLGGFGATNFSGNVRAIGSVGDTDMPVTDYARSLQNEIRAQEAQIGQPLTFQQAQLIGLPDRVLSQMVVTAALENEAKTLGISIGDERLAEEIRNVRAFQGPDGQFSRETYAMALDNAGLSESEFEAQQRSQSAATILQGAVLAGVKLPDTYIDTLIAWNGEQRAFSWAMIGRDAINTGLPVPTDAELQEWYEANIDAFTTPETKQITYAWLTPEMLVDTVEVDEASLRDAYDERFEEFNQPERRLVERLVFLDEAAAQAAADRITAGEITFEGLVAERDLDLADTDMGDVARSDLGDAAEAVFSAEVGDVAGPAPSDLGPALFRVNAVLAAQEITFEEATPDLREVLALDRARRVIDTQATGFDDELAAGATLEELAQSTDLQLGTIGWTGDNDADIAGFDAFRQAAEALSADDYPAIAQLGDGGVFALRLDEIQAPAPMPFEDVRTQVEQGWELDALTDALVASAEASVEALSNGASFEDQGLEAEEQAPLTRTAYSAALPAGLLNKVFELEPGEAAAIPGNGTAIIVRLDEIVPADSDGDAAQQLAALLRDQASNDVANDLFRALATDIQNRAGVVIDQPAINAVHANFQ
ncbi:peptidylprolyl isomerase [Tropicibacter naphthalenivorans]|uniref:Parvulin-like PPIase n=1 Tax=Tropicibacter naphthalenivorans TaxID=441103 RepID=A0A0N7LZD7_9RHOB|nr:peptidylprolyl isomerase [Tropicibacter naphthalenivorans]CUH77377.1 Peptidyl-prolyl cis-trans isomerase D [Tropicibacter naphthalenivorans]SMC58482.1 peptidyl-prolyl cis-trans isomerase D [Tropicibacter naphthalenivorans]